VIDDAAKCAVLHAGHKPAREYVSVVGRQKRAKKRCNRIDDRYRPKAVILVLDAPVAVALLGSLVSMGVALMRAISGDAGKGVV
jgi:hypothetical protein